MTIIARVFSFAPALLLVAWVPHLATQTRVVDLTNAIPNPAQWKIVASEAGGPVGTRPLPPSHVPVTLGLTDCLLRNGHLSFFVEIYNNRDVEVLVPLSMNSRIFDRPGTIEFRELLIRLGTATNAQDAITFKHDSRFDGITLFGSQSVPSTIAILAPGGRLLLRLKSEARIKGEDIGSMRASIGAFDVSLAPSGEGYRKRETWVPALSAISEPTCASNAGAPR
jgi:hypothetical protein